MFDDIVIGLDPGKNLGVSIFYLDENFEINNIETRIYYLDKFVKDQELASVERNIALEEIITDLIHTFRPMAIGCEDVFKSKFATAVIQLSQYLMTIKTSIYKADRNLATYIYPPKLVKAKIGATGAGNKDDMFIAVNKVEDLKPYVRKDMTEHEVDALAIGYITYKRLYELIL